MKLFIDILKTVDPIGYVIIFVVLLFLAFITWRAVKGRAKTDAALPDASSYEAVSEHVKSAENSNKVKIGSGSYKCLCFRKIGATIIADFTSITEPVGEPYQFDPSCPISGTGYIVKEVDGVIIDYDPRQVKVITEETPDYAWHAINWKDDVNAFWTVPAQWWKNIANWYVAAVLVAVFILGMVAFE